MFPALRDKVAEWIADGTIVIPPDGTRCVEIGALNVNGTVRDLFPCEYVGVDRVDGPGVDVVSDGRRYFVDNAGWIGERARPIHTAICLETLEHDPRAWETAMYVASCVDQFILSVPSFDGGPVMPYHDYGGDYWRFSERCVRDVLLGGMRVVACERVRDTVGCESIIAVGVRNGA